MHRASCEYRLRQMKSSEHVRIPAPTTWRKIRCTHWRGFASVDELHLAGSRVSFARTPPFDSGSGRPDCVEGRAGEPGKAVMGIVKRSLILAVVIIAHTGSAAAQQTTPAAKLALAPEEMEAFLLKAPVTHSRDAGKGVTGSTRVTLSDGRITHDAQVQAIDQYKSIFQAGKASEVNFRDTYRYNIAGYRLARLIGLTTVPMSVERDIDGKKAAVTWWIDDVMMDEDGRIKKKTIGPDAQRFGKQIQVMKIWDELIQNKDRNRGNLIWTSDWTLWLIDHTRAFRLEKKLQKPNDLTRCERGLLDGLRRLTPESLAKAVGDSLTAGEQEAVIARRDLLVQHFEARLAKLGDGILFTY
jgi:hypothetical protein